MSSVDAGSSGCAVIQSITSPAAGPFSDPVYKKLAQINGAVNKMTKEQLKDKLMHLKLDTRGQKDVLKKRLKSYYKRKNLTRGEGAPKKKITYDYFIVIDFEATCEKEATNYHHEIIEFPAVLVCASDGSKVDEFHSYVKPTCNSRLTEFCRTLTHITQDQVDAAETFPVVLNRMEEWMASHCLGKGKKFAIVTDGPWDMSRFMYLQCRSSGIPFPRWARRWINIRKAFCNSYCLQRAGVLTMLEHLGLAFEGQQHSGIDDSRNIARILGCMIADGCNLYINEKLFNWKVAATRTTTATEVPSDIVTVSQDDVQSSDDDDDGAVVGVVGTVNVSQDDTSRSETVDSPVNAPKCKEEASSRLDVGNTDADSCAKLVEKLSV